MVCSVLMCKNRSCAWRKQGVSFFKFPLRNARMLKVWLRNISRPGDWRPSPQSRICSDHFSTECLQKVGTRLELKPDALPTLYLSFRAKDAPPIVLAKDFASRTAGGTDAAGGSHDDDDADDMDLFKADHSYSSGDQEPPPPPSVEVAMKEHSYFTGVAPTTAPPPSGVMPLAEPQEAPEDHTYHSNLPGKGPSLDDHTYNRGELGGDKSGIGITSIIKATDDPALAATAEVGEHPANIATTPALAAASCITAASGAGTKNGSSSCTTTLNWSPSTNANTSTTTTTNEIDSLDSPAEPGEGLRNFDHTYNHRKTSETVATAHAAAAATPTTTTSASATTATSDSAMSTITTTATIATTASTTTDTKSTAAIGAAAGTTATTGVTTATSRTSSTTDALSNSSALDSSLTIPSVTHTTSPSKGSRARLEPSREGRGRSGEALKRSHSAIESPSPTWKQLFEENHALKLELATSQERSAELSRKLGDATDRLHKLEDHVSRLKKTLAEVVMGSVEGRHLDHHHGKRARQVNVH